MKTTHWYHLLTLAAALLLLAACSPAAPATPTVNAEELLTQAAATVAVELTKVAGLTPSPLPATATPAATSLPPTAAAPDAAPTTAPAPTQPQPNPPAPTTAQGKTPDAASFVEDVTVPDGTGAAPGATFEKVWRIKNTGETTWTPAYSLVYVDGERMGAPESIPMPKDVRPGETVDISVKLTAPQKTGSHQTFFRLRNAAGQFFRLDGTGDLWLKISVGSTVPTPDLTATAAATPGAATAEPTATTASGN